MSIGMEFAEMILAFAIASWFAGYVVDSAIRLSSLLRMKASVFAFLFVSLSTSLPELSVALFSGLRHESALGFGNLLGSNVVNFCLILGLLAYSGLKVTETMRKEIMRSASFVILVSLMVLSSRTIGRALAAVLFILFFFHIYSVGKMFRLPRIRYFTFTLEFLRDLFIFLLSSIIVVTFSSLGVEAALSFARDTGILESCIGASIIAVETSLPELLVATSAVLKRRREVSIGDVTGSNVVNSTLLLGMCAALSAVRVSLLETGIAAFSLISATLLVFLSSLEKFDRRVSAVLLSFFLIYLLFLFKFQ